MLVDFSILFTKSWWFETITHICTLWNYCIFISFWKVLTCFVRIRRLVLVPSFCWLLTCSQLKDIDSCLIANYRAFLESRVRMFLKKFSLMVRVERGRFSSKKYSLKTNERRHKRRRTLLLSFSSLIMNDFLLSFTFLSCPERSSLQRSLVFCLQSKI